MDITFLVLPAFILAYISSMTWIIMIFTSLFARKRRVPKSKIRPKFTVIIPARNEEFVVKNILNDFKKQTYKNFQLILAVNNSTDNTYKIAKKVEDKNIKVVEFTTKERTKGSALNHIVENYPLGDIVTILDTDNRVESNYLERLKDYFADKKVQGVQCRYRTSNTHKGLLPKLIELETVAYVDSFQDFCNITGLNTYFGGTGMAIRSDLIKRLKWTDCLVEDYELSLRMLRFKKKIIVAPDILIYDEKPLYFDALIHQRKRWIKGQFQALKEHFKKVKNPFHYLIMLSPFNIMSMLALFGIFYANIFTKFKLFNFIYIPPIIWLIPFFVSLGLIGIVTFIRKRRLAYLLPIYLIFGFHWYIAFFESLFLKGWSKTKHFG